MSQDIQIHNDNDGMPSQTPDFFETMNPAIPIPERFNIVPAWYQRHKNPKTTVVKQNGKLIAPGFVVSEVAPELRWAIREDGEVLGQLEFQEAHGRWYNAQYQFAGQPPDDANLRSIPLVARFVARGVDENDPSRLTPITQKTTTPPPPIQPIYNANGDLIEDEGEVERPAGLSVKAPESPPPPPPVDPIEQEELDVEAQRRASMIAQGKDPDFSAPCGKPYPAGARYLHLHTKHCKSPECNPKE